MVIKALTLTHAVLPFTERPEVPFAIKVLNKSGRSVELSWNEPYNGNSDIFQYIIQYKKAKGRCFSRSCGMG